MPVASELHEPHSRNIPEMGVGEDFAMSQAQQVALPTGFISNAELWSGEPGSVPPRIDRFVAERLCNTLEAAVVTPPLEAGQSPTSVLSVPWYANGQRQCCLLLSSAAAGGTLEVWHVDPERNELRLSSGFFGKWDEFRRITALTRFRKGEGLPGRVWDTGRPVLFEDLSQSRAFLRAEAAQSVGLQCGLGLPVRYASGSGVIAMLSSQLSPMGRSIDIWKVTGSAAPEHLQGLTFETSSQRRASVLSAARSLAADAATRFLPAVLQTLPRSAPHSVLEYGFAWPSRDDQDVIHVATVVG